MQVTSPIPRSPVSPAPVRGACPHDCPDTCSLLTTVENGIAIKVQGNPDHPQTGGVLCNKVSRYTDRTYHPERLLSPMRRSGPKGSGQFEPVSWETALSDIAARLKTIAARNPRPAFNLKCRHASDIPKIPLPGQPSACARRLPA